MGEWLKKWAKHWRTIGVNVLWSSVWGFGLFVVTAAGIGRSWKIWAGVGWAVTTIVLAPRMFVTGVEIEQLKATVNDKDNEIVALQAERDELQTPLTELLQEILQTMVAYDFKFRNTDRVTVYRHTGKEFKVAARYSRYLDWGRTVSRTEYPDNAGVLGHAWRNGECYIQDLPDPVTHFDAYLQELAALGVILDMDVQMKLRMRPRAYFAKVLMSGPTAIGVLLVESESARFTKTKTSIQQWGSSGLFKMIELALVYHKAYSPSAVSGKEK